MQQRRINTIKIPDEWVLTMGRGVTVAVIDSHITEMNDNIKKYYTVSNNGLFDSSHCWSVCEIISKVSPLSNIIVSQAIFGKRGTNEGLLKAIKNIKDDDVDVINFSLSTKDDDDKIRSCIYELSKKSLIVASMANNGSVSYPAEYDFVTSVSSYKNSNIDADLYCSDKFNFVNNIYNKTGNSMSTAFISGIFALAKSYNKNITKDEIIKQLLGK